MADGNIAETDLRNDYERSAEKDVVLNSPVSEQKPKEALVSQGRPTAWLIITAITCFLGSSFQFGYNLGVVNAPKDVCIYAHSVS